MLPLAVRMMAFGLGPEPALTLCVVVAAWRATLVASLGLRLAARRRTDAQSLFLLQYQLALTRSLL